MNLPSINTLERAFPSKGRALRLLLESAGAVNVHPAAIEMCRTCWHPPSLVRLRLAALNAEAGTYGVEHVAPGTNARSPGFSYLNTGDTYRDTIIRLYSGRYIVSSWGDIVERGNYI